MALTTLLPAGLPAALGEVGHQFPRLRAVPDAGSSAGAEAAELAARAGLVLDPWERLVLEDALGERPDGRWAAFEMGLVVPRQNGKGSCLEARELAGLFLFGERLILHSAHEVKTATEAFLRIQALITDYDEFRRRVKRVNRSHGEEGIELIGGQRLRFIARSRVAGRGFSGDVVILDEAFELPDAAMAALLPTMSAKPNPQVWYVSTAPRQQLHPHCRVLARVRRRALARDTARLAYLEWSVDPDGMNPEQRRRLRADPRAWAQANPGYAIRLNADVITAELGMLDPDDFDAERLGIGDWPVDVTGGWLVVPREKWEPLAEPPGVRPPSVAFAAEMSWDRRHAVIGAAGNRLDGLVQVELAEPPRDGSEWVIPRLLELRDQWAPCATVIDPGGPGRGLIDAAEAAGLDVAEPSVRDVAAASGEFTDLCRDGGLRHLGQSELDLAVAQAARHEFGSLWAWERKTAHVAPLMAVTLALWGLRKFGTGGDYTIGESVGFDTAEVARLLRAGVYGQADVERLAAAGIITAADAAQLAKETV
jgi:hypothetical protein